MLAPLASEENPKEKTIRFQKWKEELSVSSVSLVFSSYYMDAPASAFGHTLLKLNSKRKPEPRESLGLLDYGVNYTADFDPKDPFWLYALKGLSGGYSGKFSIFPYYTKVTEYNDWESRDIWEYELSLSPEEIDRLLEILWVSNETPKQYYFLDNNCGSALVHSLDAARGKVELSQVLRWPIAPSQVIQAIHTIPGFVKEKKMRKSLYRKWEDSYLSLDLSEQDRFWKDWKNLEPSALGNQQIPSSSPADKPLARKEVETRIYATEYYLRKHQTEPFGSLVFQNLLQDLSKMEPYSEQRNNNPEAKLDSPEQVHGFSRIFLSSGHSSFGSFMELNLRLGFHDLANSSKGFLRNAEIQFGSASLRRYMEKGSWELNHLQVLKIVSLQPYNPLTESKSYFLDIGLESISLNRESSFETKNPRTLATKWEGAYGFTFADRWNQAFWLPQFSILGGAKANQAKEFSGLGRFGPSGMLVLVYDWHSWRWQSSYSHYFFEISNSLNDFKASTQLRYSWSENWEVRWEWNRFRYFEEASVSLHYLF